MMFGRVLQCLRSRQALLRGVDCSLTKCSMVCGHDSINFLSRMSMSNWTKVYDEKRKKEKPEAKYDIDSMGSNSLGGTKARYRDRDATSRAGADVSRNNIKLPYRTPSGTSTNANNTLSAVQLKSIDWETTDATIEKKSGTNPIGTAGNPRKGSRKDLEDQKVEWMEVVYQELIENPSLAEDWNQVGLRFTSHKSLSTKWPAIFLGYIAHKEDHVEGLFEIGMSLADYVKTLGDKHNVLRLVSTICVCIHQASGGNERAFAYYDELCAITDVLDSTSTLLLIRAFGKTRLWRKCLDFLEMTKVSTTPSPSHYGPVIKRALESPEPWIADDLFKEMFLNGSVPPDDVFEYMIDKNMTWKLLEILNRFCWIPSESVALHIKSFFTRDLSSEHKGEKWIGHLTKIDKRSRCKVCSSEVDRLPRISDSNFDRLRTAFLSQAVLKKGNVFINTSPEEVDDFHDFLGRHSTFNVIIDGLNVAYRTHQKASTTEKDRLLARVIEYFLGKDMKVLVLGRNHMKSWQSSKIQQQSTNGQLEWFYANNLSADDPFMLYAALHSGQKALIVTSDELRDHRFLLGAELAELLKLWQRGHQVLFLGLNRNSNNLMFKWPDNHDTRVQMQSDGSAWHIPFDNGAERTSFQLPDNWICLRRSN